MASHEEIEKAKKINSNISSFQAYFRDNFDLYKKWMSFVHKSSISSYEKANLSELQRPVLEFPLIPQYISALCGKFEKYQPSVRISMRSTDELTDQKTQEIDSIQKHLNYILSSGVGKSSFMYSIFKNEISGGFGAGEIYYEYESEKSFEYAIKVEPIEDPTTCGFDPLAKTLHKGDGRFCYRIYVLSEEEFERMYPKNGTRYDEKFNSQDMSWCKRVNGDKYYTVVKYWEKEYKEEMLYRLSNGQSMLKKDYKKIQEFYQENLIMQQPPIVLDKRRTSIVKIMQYDIYADNIMRSHETLYPGLPLVFFPGENYFISDSGRLKQHCKPYGYNAEGIQKLKNVAGMSLANELEGLVQHKFMVPERGLPDNEDYIQAYINPQKASTMVYKDIDLEAPQGAERIAPPTAVPRQPMPPQITQAFQMADEMTQSIMGTFRQHTSSQSSPMSGIALALTNITNDATSSPYIANFVYSLTQVARIIIDLIPRVYEPTKMMPVVDEANQKSYQPMGDIQYDPEQIDVEIDAGASMAMQKEITLQTLTSMMKASPLFNEFMNKHGLPILLDNLDIKGIDSLKVKVGEFIQQKEQQEQQQAQSQSQQQKMMMQMQMAKTQKDLKAPASTEVQMQKVHNDAVLGMLDAKNNEAKTDIAGKNSDTDLLKTMSDIGSENVKHQLKVAELSAEQERTQVDLINAQERKIENEIGY